MMTTATNRTAPVRAPVSRRLKRALEPFAYVSPTVVLIAGLVLAPLALGLSYAFRDVQLLDPFSGDYVGLAHFRDLMTDKAFSGALANTAWWTFTSVIAQFFFGLLLALLLDKPFRGRGLVQALVFLPWAVPTFLVGLTWAWLFNPVVGPLPYWMADLGLMAKPENILSSPTLAIWGPVIANVWWGIPFFAITLLAALQSIPRDLYEAAQLDGASGLQRFWSITVPFLAPTMAITILLRTIWIANFADLIVVMTNGGPADHSQILASYIFTVAFKRLDFGYASAIALVLLGLLIVYAAFVLILRQTVLTKD